MEQAGLGRNRTTDTRIFNLHQNRDMAKHRGNEKISRALFIKVFPFDVTQISIQDGRE